MNPNQLISSLRGIQAGSTRLCTVGQSGKGLSYCGYNIEDLAQYALFEEVIWLLRYGHLPTQSELNTFCDQLQQERSLSPIVKKFLESLPKQTHPMDVLRTACSFLGAIEPENNFKQQDKVANRLISLLPIMLLYWYRYSHDNERINTEGQGTYAQHFLQMLGDSSNTLFAQCLNSSLILYAEHEFNASTFAARVCASTHADLHSCITTGIATLKGPLHGGANEAAMHMLLQYNSVEQAKSDIEKKLLNKEKIMGFGHAVYQFSDPRSIIIEKWADQLATTNEQKKLLSIAYGIADLLWEQKQLFPNADYYHACAYHFMNIPTLLFTPIFVCSRVAGWSAHVMEQRSNNKIIRPSAAYIGEKNKDWVPIKHR